MPVRAANRRIKLLSSSRDPRIIQINTPLKPLASTARFTKYPSVILFIIIILELVYALYQYHIVVCQICEAGSRHICDL